MFFDGIKDVVIETKFFTGWFGRSAFWFRMFGVGLSIRLLESNPLSFSERHGYKKYLQLGPWIITYLPFKYVKKKSLRQSRIIR